MHGYKVVFQPKHDDRYSWLVVDVNTGKWVDDFHAKEKAIEYVIINFGLASLIN